MIVGKYMLPKEKLVTVSVNTSLKDALDLLKKSNYLSLPVMDEEKKDLKGVLYKSMIYRDLVESDLSKEDYLSQKVEKVYTPKTIEIQTQNILEEAADLLTDAKQSFIPVYENDEFRGILTHTAIFEAYSNLLGVHKGVRLSLTVNNLKGRLAMLSSAVAKLGGNVIAFAIEDTQVMNIARLVVRVENCDIEKLKKVIENKGFKIERID